MGIGFKAQTVPAAVCSFLVMYLVTVCVSSKSFSASLELTKYGKTHYLERVRKPTNKSMFESREKDSIRHCKRIMKQFFISGFFLLTLLNVNQCLIAQFAPSVGQIGSTAMYKDSSDFAAWASSCTVIRGYQDISQPGGPYANVGDENMALGMASIDGVVSLGDGGYAILKFNTPIKDTTGADFAVFENSFDDQFLELAFVEVSSDGINYFRFPAVSNTDTITQTWSFGYTDATKINNLAGKYRGMYGTPFDISDIADHILLNKKAITHVKVIDVVGCIQNQYCTRDANGHKINDPWPTSFGSGGFDLDAVGVIHDQNHVGIKDLNELHAQVYPNPAKDFLKISVPNNHDYTISICTTQGIEIISKSNEKMQSSISLNDLLPGVYLLQIKSGEQLKRIKFVKE